MEFLTGLDRCLVERTGRGSLAREETEHLIEGANVKSRKWSIRRLFQVHVWNTLKCDLQQRGYIHGGSFEERRLSYKQKYRQSVLCLICVLLNSWILLPVEGTEFSGGTLTGKLVNLSNIGTTMLVAAVVVTFFLRRVSAFTAIAGCFLSLPLYLYSLAPGPFRKIFKGNYSVPVERNFYWNPWIVTGVILMLTTIFIAIWSMRELKSSSE